MDVLNDYLPLYPPNPDIQDLSESEISENEHYVQKLVNINTSKKRKKKYCIEDWCMVYSDELWHLWCIITEFKKDSNLLDKMDYPLFCDMCYHNSKKF
jgi:hypothetical protein